MNVRRVHTDTGSYVEPPLDAAWDDLTKLRWHAAVVTHDTGLRVEVRDGAALIKTLFGWRRRPDSYSVNVGGSSCAAFTYLEAWVYLNGVSVGVEQSLKTPKVG